MTEVLGAIFIITLGTLGHFIYDWTNHNKFMGHFFAVNESTWEHLKLIIGPSLLWFIIEMHTYNGNTMLYFSKFISLVTMMSIVPIIFYTYKSYTEKSILAIDIGSFIVAIILGQIVFHLFINLEVNNLLIIHTGFIGLAILIIKYITGTYAPDSNFIFEDPITNKFGIEAHDDKAYKKHINKSKKK